MKKFLSIILAMFMFSSVAYAGTTEVKLTEGDIVDNTEKSIKKLDEAMPLSEELFEWATGDSGTVYSYVADDKESILFILLEKKELMLYPITFDGINKEKSVKLVLTDEEQNAEKEEIEVKETQPEEKKEEIQENKDEVTNSKSGNVDKEGDSKGDSDLNGDLGGNSDDFSQSEQSRKDDSPSTNKNSSDTDKANSEDDDKLVVANNQNKLSEKTNSSTDEIMEKNTDSNVNDTNKATTQNSQHAVMQEDKKSTVIWVIIPVIILIGLVGIVLSKKKEK